MNNCIGTENIYLKLSSPVILVATISLAIGLFTFHPTYPNLFPEVPSLWWFNQGIDLDKLLSKYLELDGMWYRPSQTWTYFQVFELVFDWRNPETFRWLTIGFHTLASISVVVFTRELFPVRKYTQIFAGVYFATSPNLYFLLVEAASHDYPYIIASLWSLILFLMALNNPKLHVASKLLVSFFLYIFALTNREIVITLPILVFLAPLVFHRKFPPLIKSARNTTVTFLLAHLFIFIAYYFLHISKLPTIDSGYRTVFHWDIVAENCVNFSLWLVRIFVNAGTPAFELSSSTPGLILGIILLTVTSFVLTNHLYTKAYRSNSNLVFALVATMMFCAVPAAAGGFSWHINLAVACFAPVVGYCIENLGAYSRLKPSSYGLFVLFIFAAVGFSDVLTQMKSLSQQHGMHIVSAINDPPKIDAADDTVLIYYEIGQKPGWAFGVGKLFRFLYDDLSIIEKAYPSIYAVTQPEAKVFLSHKNPYFFRFNAQLNKWEDKTNWANALLQGRSH